MIQELEQELFYQIALTQTNNIGDVLARQLLSKFGSASSVFRAPKKELEKIFNFGATRVQSLLTQIDEKRIFQEIDFIQKHQIQPLFILDDAYPKRLRECNDAPILLYYKGNVSLNATKVISIIGTRMHTDYGLRMTESLIDGMKNWEDVLIISGLASGIDGIAHRQAVQQGIPTVGVIAHGLDTIYPAANRSLAKEMLGNGGLLTEFPSKTIAEKQNFPIRNRIVAGLSDVTVVIETDTKGGSMITAKLASSYNREVAAFPGRAIDPKSRGCNYLIYTQIAQMINNANELQEIMGWENLNKNQKSVQGKLFLSLSEEEQSIIQILESSESLHIDEITIKSGYSDSKLASILLSLELNGLLKSLPGKRFRLK